MESCYSALDDLLVRVSPVTRQFLLEYIISPFSFAEEINARSPDVAVELLKELSVLGVVVWYGLVPVFVL